MDIRLLLEQAHIRPNVFDPSKPLPQEILFKEEVDPHGGVEVWLWALHKDEG